MRGPKPKEIVPDEEDRGTKPVRLPIDLLKAVDDFAEQEPIYGSRNEIIRQAIREFLLNHKRRHPETGR